MIRYALFVCSALGMLFGSAQLSSAAEMQWHFRNNDPYAIQVELYSSSRNHVWPGGGKVYVLRDSEVHDMTISCNYGEKICYGAWRDGDTSTYWGSGYDGKQGCADCCHTCGDGDTPTRNLN